MALYQEIMKVPGLSGSSYERQKQYWKKLGLGSGYRGSYAQNIKLLGSLKKPSYGIRAATGRTTKARPAVKKQSLAQKYASTVPSPSKGPTFKETMPFYKVWGKLEPMARQAAASAINPEAQREYGQVYGDYMAGLASSGGGRFGQGWGGVGSLQAAAERRRQAQIQDMSNLYKEGFTELFYNPAEEAWSRALTQGNLTPETRGQLSKMPTWEDYASKAGTAGYGQFGTPMGAAALRSPFVGTGGGRIGYRPPSVAQPAVAQPIAQRFPRNPWAAGLNERTEPGGYTPSTPWMKGRQFGGQRLPGTNRGVFT